MDQHCKTLQPLSVGDKCFIQNQNGPHPKKWERSGIVVETLPYHQYTVKVDGSGRLTKRNRRFLRRFIPASTTITWPTNTANITDPVDTTSIADPASTSEQPPDGTDNANNSPNVPSRSPERRIPLMLRRLQPYNNPGLKEVPLPEDAGRLRTR